MRTLTCAPSPRRPVSQRVGVGVGVGAGTLAAALLTALAAPAMALPGTPAPVFAAPEPGLTSVNFRKHFYRAQPYLHGDDDRFDDTVTGRSVVPGGRLDAAGENAIDDCAARYRSYDPATGTYLGYDGVSHPCT